MDEKGFRDFCTKGDRVRKELSEETIQANIKIAKEFEAFLKKKNQEKDFRNATGGDLQIFVQYLMKNGTNTSDNFLGLLRYARFVNNREVEIVLSSRCSAGYSTINLSSTASSQKNPVDGTFSSG